MTEPISVWNSLEVAKLLVSIITPVVILMLGIWVSRLAQRVESLQWASRTIIEKRIAVYDEVAPQLNDLFCYFTFIGNWKELTPPEIVAIKRVLDRKVHIALPLFSPRLKFHYDKFMKISYQTHSGFGRDARLKTSLDAHREAAGEKWDAEWDQLFLCKTSGEEEAAQRHTIKTAYEELMNSFARELGLGLDEWQYRDSSSTGTTPHNQPFE
jgi:hypothetical protein